MAHTLPSPQRESENKREREPALAHKAANFVCFQVTWTVAVLSAATDLAWVGPILIACVAAHHVATAPRPRLEFRLARAALLTGLLFETVRALQGDVTYPYGQPVAWLPPYWLPALWVLFATTLNVSLRWLRGRLLLAAGFGAVGGPLSFVAGARLGAAEILHPLPCLLMLAVGGAVIMPLLVSLAADLDGMVPREEP